MEYLRNYKLQDRCPFDPCGLRAWLCRYTDNASHRHRRMGSVSRAGS